MNVKRLVVAIAGIVFVLLSATASHAQEREKRFVPSLPRAVEIQYSQNLDDFYISIRVQQLKDDVAFGGVTVNDQRRQMSFVVNVESGVFSWVSIDTWSRQKDGVLVQRPSYESARLRPESNYQFRWTDVPAPFDGGKGNRHEEPIAETDPEKVREHFIRMSRRTILTLNSASRAQGLDEELKFLLENFIRFYERETLSLPVEQRSKRAVLWAALKR